MSTKIDWYRMRDAEHPQNSLYEGIADFDGLKQSRAFSCKCMIILQTLSISIGLIFYFYFYFLSDTNRLHSPPDYRADLCGLFQLNKLPYLYYVNPLEQGMTGTCVNHCPQNNQQICFYFNNGIRQLEDYCYSSYSTKKVNKYCVPTDHQHPYYNLIMNKVTSFHQILQLIIADCHLLFLQIVMISLSVCLLQLITNFITLQCFTLSFGKLTTYMMTITGSLSLSLISYLLYLEQSKQQLFYCSSISNDCIPKTIMLYKGIMFVTGLLAVYNVMYALYAYKRIKVFFQLKFLLIALKQQKKLLLLTCINQIATCILVLLFGYFTLLAISTADIKTITISNKFPSKIYRGIEYSYNVNILYICMLSLVMISVNYVKSINRMILTGAVSVYFFNFVKVNLNKPLLRSLFLSIFKQSGQVVKGNMQQMIMYYPQKITNLIQFLIYKYHDKKRQSLSCINCLLTCFKGPLTLYESHLKYFHNDNYLHMMIYGDSYRLSGEKVFYLKQRNASRLNIIYLSLGYQSHINTIAFASFNALVLFANLQFKVLSIPNLFINPDITSKDSYQFQAIVIFLTFSMNYFCCNIQANTIDQCIRTAMLTHCADEEMYYGKQRRSQPLREQMDKWGVESEKIKGGRLKVNKQIELQTHEDLYKKVQNNIDLHADDRQKDDNFDDFFEDQSIDEEYQRKANEKKFTVNVQNLDTVKHVIDNDNAQQMVDKIQNQKENKHTTKMTNKQSLKGETIRASEVNQYLKVDDKDDKDDGILEDKASQLVSQIQSQNISQRSFYKQPEQTSRRASFRQEQQEQISQRGSNQQELQINNVQNSYNVSQQSFMPGMIGNSPMNVYNQSSQRESDEQSQMWGTNRSSNQMINTYRSSNQMRNTNRTQHQVIESNRQSDQMIMTNRSSNQMSNTNKSSNQATKQSIVQQNQQIKPTQNDISNDLSDDNFLEL